MGRWHITGKNKMKKSIIIMSIGMAIATIMVFSFKNVTDSLNSSTTEVSAASIRTISVTKITGSGVTTVNSNYTGKYDTDDNYIVIYSSNGKQVDSGTPQRNSATSGKRGNYNYCLHNTYYFNL